MKKIFLSLFVVASILSVEAKIDSVSIRSHAMNKQIPALVVLPTNYQSETEKAYPVIYLLHGHGDNFKAWSRTKPNLEEIATEKQIIFVCPDGQTSWYWDSPIDSTIRYDTFISKELTSFVDQMYKTIPSPKGRAITGLSMGGHGGLWLAINHQDIFGAGGSTSGGVDIRPFPDNWHMKDALGEYAENKERWDAYTVINQLDKLEGKDLAIIFDCGYDDFFFEVNNQLHQELLKRKIKHDYIVRPGAHNHDYWRNSIDYQILFFQKFFQK